MFPYLFFHLKKMSGLKTKATRKQEAPQLFVDSRMESVFEVLETLMLESDGK